MSVSSTSTDNKTVDTRTTNASSAATLQSMGTAQAGQIISPKKTDISVNQVNVAATNPRSAANPNGPFVPPNRASPVPNQANLPNGKPTSPLVATSNAMQNGGTNSPQTVTSKDPKAAAQAASDMRNIVRRKLTGYVGFANLPNQWHRKSVRKGFNFNVMVVGEYSASPMTDGELTCNRRIRSWQVHAREHPVQYFVIPTERAQATLTRFRAEDSQHTGHQRGYRREWRSPPLDRC